MQNDIILFWNSVALEANRQSFTNGKMEQPGPALSARALAIVHIAMYEAYARIISTPDLPPYLQPSDLSAGDPLLSPPTGISAAKAAVSAAAYHTLTFLYPSQKDFFEGKFSESGGTLNEGYNYGLTVAKKIIAYQKDEPNADAKNYIPSFERGKHKVDPDNPGQGFYAPFYGSKSKAFAVTQRFGLVAPPALTSAEYTSALKEVRGKGISPDLMGTLPPSITARSENETLIGLYWGYDGSSGLGTPPRLYNQIVRKIALEKANSEAENARLFALINVAMADAGILCWDQKYIHNFWRPVVGIREHDESMGTATIAKDTVDDLCDCMWLPFGAPATNALNQNLVAQQTSDTYPKNQAVLGKVKNFTPPFPSYPSGHATFGAAALHITRLFYGPEGVNKGGVSVGDKSPDTLFDNLDFVSEELNGINQDARGTVRPRHVRKFTDGLWQMIKENGRSRVYLGVHWVFDAFAVDGENEIDLTKPVGGVPLGIKTAEDIFTAGMKKTSIGPMETLPVTLV